MPSILAVETERLCKVYRNRAVINNLTLSIAPGEVVGVLGLNAAGKSTLLRMLVGAARPTSGSLHVLSLPPGDPGLRGRVGYLPEKCPLQEFLTAHEALSLHGALMGLERRELMQRIPEILSKVGAPAGRIGEMSRGMRQRVGVAQAFLCNPEVTVLDEPASALDPAGREILKDLISARSAEGGTAIISSHLITDAERDCSRIVILSDGETVADGAPKALLPSGRRLLIETASMNEKALSALITLTDSVSMDVEQSGLVRADLKEGCDSAAVATALVMNGVDIIRLEPQTETLEELLVRVSVRMNTGIK